MPQLDRGLIKDRAGQLRAVGDAALRRHLEAEIGRHHLVLVEKTGLGRTEQFTLTEIDRGEAGDIVPAVVTGHTERTLISKAA